MTAVGVRVFRGAHKPPYDMEDFLDLAQSSLPREARDTLMAIDRANARPRGTNAREAAPGNLRRRERGRSRLRSVTISSSPAN